MLFVVTAKCTMSMIILLIIILNFIVSVSVRVNYVFVTKVINHLRKQYHFGSTLKELFSNTSVNDIIAFIKDTHFYTRI